MPVFVCMPIQHRYIQYVCFVETWPWLSSPLLAIRKGSYSRPLGLRETHSINTHHLRACGGVSTCIHTHTVQAVASPLPIKPLNGCLCFHLTDIGLKTGSQFSKVIKKLFNRKAIPPPQLFHFVLTCGFFELNEQLCHSQWAYIAEGGIIVLNNWQYQVCCISPHASDCFLYSILP